MKNLLIILLFSFAHTLYGQSISIFDIDTTNFPTMKAKFWTFDKDGNQVRPSVSELTISENGINRKITNVSCPIPPPIKRVSVAMSIDVSGSMGYSDFGLIPVELGKLTATDLCNLIQMPQSEFALQTCNGDALIIQDFTNNKSKILNSIPLIKADGGNDFVEHLLNKITGLLNISKTGKNKRVAVLFTDAWWYALEPDALKSCLDTCRKYNIEFYTIIYSRKENEPNGIKASLKEICVNTGGTIYDGIISTEASKDIANKIQKIVQGAESCEITWESGTNCSSTNINIEFSWMNIKSTSNYINSDRSIVSLKVKPSKISFGKISYPTIKDTTITLTAINSNFVVNDIKLSYGSSVFSIVNTNFPFTIPNNESKNITLRFTPIDSSMNYASFVIETDLCQSNFSSNGGYPKVKLKTKTIELTKPNGGEIFVVGSDTIITWGGISPTDTCTLEFSNDNGKNWSRVTNIASNLKYNWKKIPLPKSDSCLYKIIQKYSKDTTLIISTHSYEEYIGNNINSNINGEFIITDVYSKINNNYTLSLWDLNNGVKLFTLKEQSSSPITSFKCSIEISPDSKKIVIGDWQGNIKIWDFNNPLSEILLLKNKLENKNDNQIKVSRIVFTKDSKYFATTNDYFIILWDINNGKKLIEFQPYDSVYIQSLYLTPDALKLVTEDQRCIRIWDMKNGVILDSLFSTNNPKHKTNNTTKINNDGSLLVYANTDSTILIYDLIKLKIIGIIQVESNIGAIQSICLSYDSNLLSVGFDKYIKLFSMESLEELKSIIDSKHTYNWYTKILKDNTKILSFMGEVGNPSGELKIWDLINGNELFSIYLNNLSNFNISSDDNKIIIGENGFGYHIYHVYDLNFLNSLQEDQSDAVFSIVAPSPSSQDIDIKKCLVGSTKDSLITSFVMNKGNYPFRVDSIYFTGTDASAFSQVSGFPNFNVDKNSSKTVELRFQPKRIGLNQAKVNIITQTDTLVQNIIGEGVQPSIEIVNSWIDFGYVDIFSSKDTLQALTIKNISPSDINITNTYHLGPNDKDFTTLAGGGAFKLKAGETAKLDLRFAPKSMGRTSGRLMFDFNGPGSPAMVQLFGTGIGGEAILKIDSFSTKTGALIDIPINLTLDSKVIKSGTKAFNFEIAYNKTLLYPLETYNTKEENGYSIIRFDNMPITTDPLQVIITLKFQIALGNAVETPLEIRTLEPIGNTEDIDVTMINGNLKLTDVCYDGGTRLLSGTTQTNLFAIYPNPANDNIEIEYSNADNGLAEFKLINVMGEVVNIIQLEKVQNGKAKMNLKDLPSGQYFGVFNTESMNQNIIISVIK